MLVELQKWGNSAALRVPASTVKELGLRIGQKLNLKAVDGKIVVEQAGETLEDLVARITPENCHGLVFDGPAVGNEAW